MSRILQPHREHVLSKELKAFCAGANIPLQSADELLYDDSLNLNEKQQFWLEVFIKRWEIVTEEGL